MDDITKYNTYVFVNYFKFLCLINNYKLHNIDFKHFYLFLSKKFLTNTMQ